MNTITTTHLTLEPLVVAHADVMFEVLSDSLLYHFLDHPPPPSIEHLRSVYARLETRAPPDGAQRWLNWVIHPHGQPPIGCVQATVVSQRTAWVAYVMSSKHWGRGYATEATQAMIEHLASAYEILRYLATVEAENQRSIRLLARIGFHGATPQELVGHRLSPTERLFVR